VSPITTRVKAVVELPSKNDPRVHASLPFAPNQIHPGRALYDSKGDDTQSDPRRKTSPRSVPWCLPRVPPDPSLGPSSLS